VTGFAEVVVIVAVALLMLVAVPFAARSWIRRLRSNAEAEVLAGGRVRLIDASANLAGVMSRGVTQLRGNGCLAAYEDELVFVQWVPRRTLRIPRSAITGIDRQRIYLGKTKGTPMLEVLWNGADGSDSAAWWVADLEAWERELRPTP
jgi:hypothetical protein